MRARCRCDGLRGDGSGTAVQRIRRSPCGRAPATARGEDDERPMAYLSEERLLRQHRQHRLRPCSRVRWLSSRAAPTGPGGGWLDRKSGTLSRTMLTVLTVLTV